MQLHDLKPRPGAKNRTKRLGCGESSGHGKTSGRGHKGQRARSGGSVRLGFEGGQWPLYRRIPKRGFNNNAFSVRFAPVNLSALNVFDDGAAVDEKALREKGLVTGKWDGVKILANGELNKKLTISVAAASEAAKAKVAAAGGMLNLPAAAGDKK
ncbi:MAG: 50S ribosomal protein L15 [Verrucomicrobiales bacterium]|jgi:large subunit ribosomal protein L15|nr:50S ribosomal protein L15 [Verrucomicrobiales bacterium]